MKKVKFLSVILCLVLALSIFPVSAFAASVGDFKDVAANDWFYDDVKFVTEKGLFQGASVDAFDPDGTMTCGMAITVLHRMVGGSDGEVGTAQPYYATAMTWAAKNEIIGKTFDPEAKITREQLAVLLCNLAKYLGKDTAVEDDTAFNTFADCKDVSAAAKPAVLWALANDVLRGSDNSLLPKATATRAQVAALIARAHKLLIPQEFRIACLAPSMVECVYALGYGDYIVGWSEYTDYPVAATETEGYLPYQYYYDTYGSVSPMFDVEMELGLKDCVDINGKTLRGVRKAVATVSSFYDYNHEILAALNPTLILCEGTEQAGWFSKTAWNWSDEAGDYVEGENPDYLCDKYDAVCYVPESIDEIYDMMIDLGQRLGCKAYAEELVAGYYARIEEIQAITKDLTPIRTYFEIAHQSDYGEWGKFGPYTEGSGTPFQEMIAIAGGNNIFSDKQDYYHVYGEYGDDSFAEIAKRDPQVILSPYWPGANAEEVTTLYEIMTREHFDETEAVQTGRVYFYDSSLLKRFGPRTVTAIEKLAYLLHPYYFANPEKSVSPWELGKIDVAENFPKPLD